MMALEWVLARSGSRRTAVTYRELAGIAPASAYPTRDSAPQSRDPAAQPLPAVNIAGSKDFTADSPA